MSLNKITTSQSTNVRMLNVAVIMLGTFANNKMNKRIKRYALNVKRNRYIATLYSSIVLNAK